MNETDERARRAAWLGVGARVAGSPRSRPGITRCSAAGRDVIGGSVGLVCRPCRPRQHDDVRPVCRCYLCTQGARRRACTAVRLSQRGIVADRHSCSAVLPDTAQDESGSHRGWCIQEHSIRIRARVGDALDAPAIRTAGDAMTNTTRTDAPICPHCGYVHKDAWEWRFGPGLDGDSDRECDNCEQPFHCERIVDVSYSTKAPQETEK